MLLTCSPFRSVTMTAVHTLATWDPALSILRKDAEKPVYETAVQLLGQHNINRKCSCLFTLTDVTWSLITIFDIIVVILKRVLLANKAN